MKRCLGTLEVLAAHALGVLAKDTETRLALQGISNEVLEKAQIACQ